MIGTSELIVLQILNFALLIGYPLLAIIALLQLRTRNLASTAQALWVLILLTPYLGPIAFWIINPNER
ncbi:MAG: hypothetical protein ACK8QZ_02895 [Anaerolineales bacterium]